MAAVDEVRLRELLAAHNHADAFALLFAAFRHDIARFVELRVDPASAEDVTQEVWGAAQTAVARFRMDCRPGVWLRAIARRKVVDHWRAHASHDTLDSELSRDDAMASALGLRQASTPTQRRARSDRAEAMRTALRALSQEERDLLTLRYVDDLKPAEIAIVIGGDVSPNTIAQRLVRLCRRLRERLQQHPALS